jgi:hypothetical protein
LAEWRRAFPDEQLLITFYDDLRSDPQEFINNITAFIGIRSFTLSDSLRGHVYSSDRMTQPRNYLATRTATVFAEWCKARKLDKVVATARNSPLIKLLIGGGKPLSDASPLALERLAELFRPEVEGLETQLGRALNAWKVYE